ncbi:uncharacterized protein F4822DRAFT_362848 [Hypoxylon trugodes]|uniref:uncharacterized protein n=1 Tax=Hypoxylon trugodes TaxID=326681 RepID=UPI0021984491|nr:uncharacterized protein F4822DRAFT_362848 [Hypoxylon trugodes]KAI1384407.1 hypothetical protein F4822DRAFT_362848 [Hypoxylon trugodes]
MVVQTTTQLRSTYNLWQRFHYPTDKGPIDAIAVPKSVGDYLNSAYALILDLAILQFWTILFGLVIFYYIWRKKKISGGDKEKASLSPLAYIFWNKKGEFIDLILATVISGKWKQRMAIPLLFLILIAWVGQKAAGSLVPPLILLGNAAPVNPSAIYVPDNSGTTNASRATLFTLEVPRFLRALGSTSIGDALRQKVNISTPVPLGQTSNGDDIQRIDYWYTATGTDFGLQKYPGLTLSVAGSCTTEYGWLMDSSTLDGGSQGTLAIDDYDVFGELISASVFDGRQPSASFLLGNYTQGTLADSNTTWAAVVSSVNRTSFTAGTDPWYLTAPGQSETGAGYSVLPGRPVLSCWEDDVWSYGGRNSTIVNLGSDALPGLDLAADFQGILSSIFSNPMILLVGQHLQASALLSATTANGQVFNAEASSIHNDLERLVQAAYVATVNCLTDLTLYPAGADRDLANIALDDTNQPRSDVAEFVVWSPDVAALSTVVVIVIPSVFVGVWLIATVLLYAPPVNIVNKLSQKDDVPDKIPAPPGDDENRSQNDTKGTTPPGKEVGQPGTGPSTPV